MSFFSTPTISSSTPLYTKARISSNYNGARNKPGPKKLYTSSPPRKQASSRKSPKLKTKKLPSLHHNSVASGGDATTYTCLPPKDEVFLGGFGEESGVEAEVVSFSKYEYDRLVSLNDGLGKRLDFDEGSVGRLDFGDDGVVEGKGYKGLGKRLDFDEGNVERLDFDDDRVVEAKEYKGLGKRLDFGEDSVEMIGFDDDGVVEGKGYEFDGLNKGKRLDFDEDGVEIIDFDDDSVVEASDRLLSLNKGLGKRLNIGGNEVKRLDFGEDNVGRLDFDEDNVVEAKGYECDELLSLDEGLEEGLDFDGEDEGVVEKGVMSFDGNGESLDFDDEDEGVVGKGVMVFEGNGRKVGNGGSLEFDYGKFELYELDGDGLDFDEDEEGGDGDVDVVEFEGEEGEEIKEKEKGVPAVMRCFDRAKIMVRAGDGGNGVVAFRREKFVPLGGPSGGDGGRGGNVYVEVEGSMNSLLPFRQKVHFRAGRGSHGQGSKQNGARGEDVVVKVPPGTVIRQAADESGEQGEVLLELLHPGQRALLLPGGKGGRGNASFKSGMNKVPKIAENGEQGIEMWLDLELKLVADVGIIGAPNAGKSTFLSVVSAAQPAIANYPFTTLLPNLGVVTFGFDASIVVADLPGLLEGAHRGFGLGHEFLRHTERCSVLVHVIDGSSQQPEYEFDAVRLELEMFNPEVTEKPYLVVYNKMDLPEASENWISFRESLRSRGIEPFCMSAAMADGTYKVICAAYELVRKKREAYKDDVPAEVNLNHVADMMQKQRTAPINDFKITHDSDSGTWHVDGAGLLRFVQMTNWRYLDSERRFQHVLDACGVFKSLVKLGVKEGDTVLIGEMELVWHDSSDSSGPARLKKWAEKSIK